MWCSGIGDIHDSFCGCDQPFAHLFTCIFPPGHPDRNKTVEQILCRDYKQRCRGGGIVAEGIGMGALDAAEEGGHLKEEGLDTPPTAEDLAFAAAAAEKDG